MHQGRWRLTGLPDYSALREVLGSKDGKAWILPIGLAGDLGTQVLPRRDVRTHRETNCGRNHVVDGKRDLGPRRPQVADLTDAGKPGSGFNRAGDRRDVASHLDGHLSQRLPCCPW